MAPAIVGEIQALEVFEQTSQSPNTAELIIIFDLALEGFPRGWIVLPQGGFQA